MSNSKSSYRQIFTATTLFGSIQLMTMLISVIKTKIISFFLGPIGIGIIGLFTVSIEMISTATNFGLQTSATKVIAEIGINEKQLSRTINVVQSLAWITGILAVICVILFSNWLSVLTFGNDNYYLHFIWISISLFFKQITAGRLAILQGLRKLNSLAKANLYGSLLGLVITIPLYYYWRIDAIVPSIIATSVIGYLIVFYHSKTVKTSLIQFSNQKNLSQAKNILYLGVMLSLSGFITLLASFIIQIFINRTGSIMQVGFYNAGFTILNTYVGIVFTVMATDYFPRLATVINDKTKISVLVVEQATFSILVITPIIIIFQLLVFVIVEILYSKEFFVIIAMISWGILGMLFKAVSWSMGLILIAKGDSKLFIKTAILFNLISVMLNVFGYYLLGLEGLGISFLIYFFIHFYGIKIIVKKQYGIYCDTTFYKLYLLCILMCILTFTFRYIDFYIVRVASMIFMSILSMFFSVYHLNQKIDLREIVMTKFNSKK